MKSQFASVVCLGNHTTFLYYKVLFRVWNINIKLANATLTDSMDPSVARNQQQWTEGALDSDVLDVKSSPVLYET